MANTNFTVHNGLTVGPTSIDATSGNISTTATFVTTNATNSTSTITGAMVISGGLGVGGSVNANAYYSNYYLYSNGSPITTPAGGGNTMVQFNDGTNFAGATYLQYNKTSGNLVSNSTTTSTSTSTGAITTPSLGVAGNVNANAYYSNYYLYSNGAPITTPAGGSNTFVQFNDGTNFAGATYLQYNKTSGNLVSNSTTASTSTTTGALVLSGGAGIGGSVYIGGSLSVGGNTTFINTTVITTTDTIAAPAINAGTIGNSGATLYGTLNSSSASQTNITSVGTLGSLTVSGTTNLQGTTNGATINAATLQGGTIGNSGATLYGTLNSSSASQTNITSVGTLTGLTTSGAIVPSSNASVNLGSTSAYWNNVYAVNFLGTSTTAKYADLAERYTSDADYEPGTVVDFGGTAEVTLSNINGSQYVAGVVSTNPAYMMNSDSDGLYIALQGRVPCKVTGPIEKGAMMVSNGDGTARMERNPKIGSVIGKALQSFGDGVGVIEVVVGRL